MAVDSVSSDWLSDWVSVPAVLVVRSLTASVSEYGEEVRVLGMTSPGRIVPVPRPSRVNTRWPSSDPVRMWARGVTDPVALCCPR